MATRTMWNDLERVDFSRKLCIFASVFVLTNTFKWLAQWIKAKGTFLVFVIPRMMTMATKNRRRLGTGNSPWPSLTNATQRKSRAPKHKLRHGVWKRGWVCWDVWFDGLFTLFMPLTLSVFICPLLPVHHCIPPVKLLSVNTHHTVFSGAKVVMFFCVNANEYSWKVACNNLPGLSFEHSHLQSFARPQPRVAVRRREVIRHADGRGWEKMENVEFRNIFSITSCKSYCISKIIIFATVSRWLTCDYSPRNNTMSHLLPAVIWWPSSRCICRCLLIGGKLNSVKFLWRYLMW